MSCEGKPLPCALLGQPGATPRLLVRHNKEGETAHIEGKTDQGEYPGPAGTIPKSQQRHQKGSKGQGQEAQNRADAVDAGGRCLHRFVGIDAEQPGQYPCPQGEHAEHRDQQPGQDRRAVSKGSP